MKRKIAAILCVSFGLFFVPSFIQAQTVSDREAVLKAELEKIEQEKKEIQKDLDRTKQKSASIERDVSILTSEINAAKLTIRSKNILIERLGKDITSKTKKIGELGSQIERGKESLGQIVRKMNEIDSYSLPEIVLANRSLSDTLVDIDVFSSVNRSLAGLFTEIRDTKTTTEKEKTELDTRRSAELDARAAIEAEKRTIETKEAEKKRLLALSKQKESSYAQVIAEKEKRAQAIRSALFELRDSSTDIQFGTALEYAKQVSKATGVRPAFLLAILTQESNLGKNVGSCYLTNTQTGAGVGVKTGNVIANVMKPDRDVQPFLKITSSLGRDPMKTLVSCPQSIGYGGAMGPAQFIPSTWMIFKDKIARSLGVEIADPWKPLHAFMASGTYLGELGASMGVYSAEINAACRYYSGRSCAPGSVNYTYGTQVMAKAANIQENMINVLENK